MVQNFVLKNTITGRKIGLSFQPEISKFATVIQKNGLFYA